MSKSPEDAAQRELRRAFLAAASVHPEVRLVDSLREEVIRPAERRENLARVRSLLNEIDGRTPAQWLEIIFTPVQQRSFHKMTEKEVRRLIAEAPSIVEITKLHEGLNAFELLLSDWAIAKIYITSGSSKSAA